MKKAPQKALNQPVGPQVPPALAAPVLAPPIALSETALTCVVCGKAFERTVNLRKKAKVCTPFEFKHVTRYDTQPDGVVKKVPCQCCRCLYKKTMSKNRSLDGKLIPMARIEEFLGLVKAQYPEVHLAFRVGLNAMLRVTELASIRPADLEEHHKPLPILKILALKKTVKMYYPVDLTPGISQDLRAAVTGGLETPIFDIPVRTLQHKFKQVVKKMGLGHLSIHALRHTGISIKARECRTMDELNYLRSQARHESIETTKLYMGFEDQQRVEMHGRFKVY